MRIFVAMSSHWFIASAMEIGRTLQGVQQFSIVLAAENGARASASVEVRNRAAEQLGGTWDPAVTTIECSRADAREWLEAHEHEFAIAEACFAGGLRRAS
jgi:hypothetical protein